MNARPYDPAAQNLGRVAAAFALALACVSTMVVVAIPARAQQPTGLFAGEYRTVTTSPGQKKPSVGIHCYDAQEIKRVLVRPPAEGKCTTQRATIAGGRIDIERSCAGAKGTTTSTMAGRYGPTAYAFRLAVKSPALPEPFDVRFEATRIGAGCAAGE